MTSPNKPKALYAKEDHAHPPVIQAPYEHDHDHYHTELSNHQHQEQLDVTQRLIDHTNNLNYKLAQTVRALIRVFEVGVTNSEQSKALHNVRVAIGDAYGTGCLHEQRAFEKGDRLICQSCRLDVTRQFKT